MKESKTNWDIIKEKLKWKNKENGVPNQIVSETDINYSTWRGDEVVILMSLAREEGWKEKETEMLTEYPCPAECKGKWTKEYDKQIESLKKENEELKKKQEGDDSETSR